MEVWPHCETLAEGGRPQCIPRRHFSVGAGGPHHELVKGPIQVATKHKRAALSFIPTCPLTGIWPRTLHL